MVKKSKEDDSYYLFKSNKPEKKFFILKNGQPPFIHFGASLYDDYTQHLDKERRDRYLKRAKKIKNKNGDLTFDDPKSPNFWAINLLWNRPSIEESIQKLYNKNKIKVIDMRFFDY